VDRFDDFGVVVDALQIDRGDPEVAVSELALDDDQRHAAARYLDRVCVPQLVRREASQHQCLVDPKAGSPQDRDQPAKPPTVQPVADDLHGGDHLRDGRWTGRIPQTLLRGTTGMKAGNRRRRATTTGCAKSG
jgi:hypothetical protein